MAQLQELGRPSENAFQVSATLFRFDTPSPLKFRGITSTSTHIRGLLNIGQGDVAWRAEHPGDNKDAASMMAKLGMVPAGRFSLESTMLPNQNYHRYLTFVRRRGDVILVHTIDNAGKDTSTAKKVLDPKQLYTVGRLWWFYVTMQIPNQRFRSLPTAGWGLW